MQRPFSSLDHTRSDGRASTGALDVAVSQVEAPPPDRGLTSRRVSSVRARDRLEEELRAIAADLLGPDESGELPAASAAWVATTTGAAAAQVCDSALEGLVQALDAMLIGMPPDVARQLQRARQRREAGFR